MRFTKPELCGTTHIAPKGVISATRIAGAAYQFLRPKSHVPVTHLEGNHPLRNAASTPRCVCYPETRNA